jgi:hypothetical protein
VSKRVCVEIRSLGANFQDMYNCAMRGHFARLEMCLDSFFMRKQAALRNAAPFHCLDGEAEDPALFDLDFLTPRHRTCLLLAARVGSDECCRLLLDKGASVNVEGHGAMTALHWAARQGTTDCVKLLLRHGANVWAESREGFTPLHCALNLHRCGCM